MVGFSSSLRMSRRRGWESAYLNYESLKLLLTQIEAVYEDGAAYSTISSSIGGGAAIGGGRRRKRRKEGSVSAFGGEFGLLGEDENGNGGDDIGVGNEQSKDRDYRDDIFLVSDSDVAFEA
eukprot:2738910-Ditylum_brightwellii.AAC.1